ncbi:MAG: hypothetical protein K0S27_603 [Gammaproteobacteria bacterium]|jgi:alpha/beta superfamily hydrolase|nr:hypothetical protein [Gammaproteobacteria bacterium]
MLSFPSHESTFLFPGPAGDIEIVTTAPESNLPTASVIICHPHPLYGGTLHNKVVSVLARAFQNLGLRTVRFNFRGVGKSAGVHDEGRGETTDVIVLAQWLQMLFPRDALWLAGFSFGGFVAASAATQLSVERLISIAPQVSRFLSPKLSPITCPWVIVQGEEDDIVSPDEVYAWVKTLQPRPQLIRFPGAGHFFHGQLVQLRQTLEAVLKP